MDNIEKVYVRQFEYDMLTTQPIWFDAVEIELVKAEIPSWPDWDSML